MLGILILKTSAPGGLSTSHPFSQDFTHPRSARALRIPQSLLKRSPFLIPSGFSTLGFVLSCPLSSPIASLLPCCWSHLSPGMAEPLSSSTPSHGKEQTAQWWPESLYEQNKEHFSVPQETSAGSSVPWGISCPLSPGRVLICGCPFYLLWFNVNGWNLTVMTTAGASPPSSQAQPGSL